MAITPIAPIWRGFLLSRRRLRLQGVWYWAAAAAPMHWQYELAGLEAPKDWARTARGLLCEDKKGEWIEYFDRATGGYRAARLTHGILESCIFIAPGALPARDWLAGLFQFNRLDASARRQLLAGGPAAAGTNTGRMICVCRGVSEAAIRDAVRTSCASVAELGARLGAGTGCGSCVPELKVLLGQELSNAAMTAR